MKPKKANHLDRSRVKQIDKTLSARKYNDSMIPWVNQMRLCPPAAQMAWLKILRLTRAILPTDITDAERTEIIKQSRLTAKEKALLQRHFPDGFWGEPKP